MKGNYIDSALKQFEYYKILGAHTISQLSETELHWHYNTESNSVVVIINHLSGNMKSRWTDFLTTDGEKKWRNRDVEFEPVSSSKAALLHKWKDGWTCLFKALKSIDKDNFNPAKLNLTKKISEAVNIPVIASGGVGTLDHLVEGIKLGKADAVLAASIFHYGEYTIQQAKTYLFSCGIEVALFT